MFLTVLDKNASDSAMLFISFILMTLIVAVFINAARTGYECVQMSVDIYKALCPVFFRQLHIRVGHQVFAKIL